MEKFDVFNPPKDPQENLRWRRILLGKCANDLVFRSKIKELFHRDIIWAFNAFFWTLDVRKNPDHHQPFCTYPFQDEAILKVQGRIFEKNGEEKGDLIIEKSRDMGWSWMVILCFEHAWLDPRGGGDFLLGSRIEDYVDKKGDMRSLLEKARYNLYRLPKWLRPNGFNKKRDDNFARLVNPETGASITGESNNPNWSTGGRYLAALLDEFAKWEGSDKSAWTAAGDATPCRIALSTPFAAGGHYYTLAHSPEVEKIVTHWSLHPEKAEGLSCKWPRTEDVEGEINEFNWSGLTSEWYERECRRRRSNPAEIKQELDIGYIGSGQSVFTGKALERIKTLLRNPMEPHSVYRYLDGQTTFQLESYLDIREPDDYLDYIVIYEEPRAGVSYLVVADVAEGKEDGDYSVVKVLERGTENVVASCFTLIDEVRLADIINGLWKLYTKGDRVPWWAVETIGPGLSTFDQCLARYPEMASRAFMMPTGFDQATQKPTFRKGWWTSTTSKHAIIGALTNYLLKGSSVCDPRCARELTTFEYVKGRPKARSGCHDDEVMCLGIALKVNELLPMEQEEASRELMESGVPKEMFKLEKKEEPPSLEEQCFAHLMEKKEKEGRFEEDDFAGYSSSSIFEPLEELGIFD